MKKLIAIIFISLSFAACQSTGNLALSQDQVKTLGAQFQKMHVERLLQLSKGNVDKAVECYTEDAYLMDIGATAKGRGVIREHLAAVLTTMSINEPVNTQEGLEVSGNLAYDYGSTSMRLDFITGETMVVHSKYIAIWKKNEKGQWLISKLIFNQENTK